MNAAVIIARIADALQAGKLKALADAASFKPIGVMGDLLRPWEEVFPGAEIIDGDETRNRPFWGGLLKPRLVPQVRRSLRPLPVPMSIAPPPSTVSPGMFASIKGIWEYYQGKGMADEQLLQLPFTDKGLEAFVAELYLITSDYWPLFVNLENIGYDGEPRDMHGINLMLPHYTYDDEGCGVFEAFLSDAESVHAMLQSLYEEQDTDGKQLLDLPDKDRGLISEQGFEKLIESYLGYQGEKSYDLAKLFDFPAAFFTTVSERFSKQMATDWPIISGNGGSDMDMAITCKEDIEFCLAYAEAYAAMVYSMPDPNDFAFNEGGVSETFVHELCEVWRKVNKKRPVKWTSPKADTLAQKFKRGEF